MDDWSGGDSGYGSYDAGAQSGGGYEGVDNYAAQFDYTPPSSQEIADFQAALDALNGGQTGIATGNAYDISGGNFPSGPYSITPGGGDWQAGPGGAFSISGGNEPTGISVSPGNAGAYESTLGPAAAYNQPGFMDRLNSWLSQNVLQNAPIIGSFIRGGNFLNDFATRNGLDVQRPSFAGGAEGVGGGFSGGGVPIGGAPALGGQAGGLMLPGGSGGFQGFQNAGPFLGDPNYRAYGINY